MNSQKDGMITRQALEQYMEDEDNLWTLGSPTRTSRMKSPSASITTSTVIWQRNGDWKRRNEKHKYVLN